MSAPDFAWVPFFEQLADRLLGWRDRQPELIAFLEELRGRGLPVTPLNDRDETGRTFLMTEIDPFTFLGAFNRGIHDQKRRTMLTVAAERFGVTAAVPTTFPGVPVLNNQSSWFISYQFRRTPGSVQRLWEVFARALGDDPLADPAFLNAFDAAMGVRGTNVNLTIGLFWVRPRTFMTLDSRARAALGVTLPPKGIDAAWYRDTVAVIVAARGPDLPRVSWEAWVQTTSDVEAEAEPAPLPPTGDDAAHWLVGAWWDGVDQTERFLAEGIWENGYADRHLDEVRAMRPGDRIAIKSSSVQTHDLPFDAGGRTVSMMPIKAVGTVVENPGDGRVVEVEWQAAAPPRVWYFYTYRGTVWRLKPDDELARRLIRFVFHGEAQDYAWFAARWWGGAASPPEAEVAAPPYGLADLRREGAFLTDDEVATALRRLRSKRNLILQGAPGTGKTFVARKLAWLLMEERDPSRVEVVQFHPSTSYEDFVRGYRPTKDAGRFELRDGPFLELCARARADERPHVLVIDEINRGNLAQVFGELLMLLEADKRGREHAVTPLYRRATDERLEVPENLYVIGTMNQADRSLAVVDTALRRRFAWLTLAPRFDAPSYRQWLAEHGMAPALIQRITARMQALNAEIGADRRLGPALRIGHSFFCPSGDLSRLDGAWFREVVETEVAPLLEEYWHEEPERAERAIRDLLA